MAPSSAGSPDSGTPEGMRRVRSAVMGPRWVSGLVALHLAVVAAAGGAVARWDDSVTSDVLAVGTADPAPVGSGDDHRAPLPAPPVAPPSTSAPAPVAPATEAPSTQAPAPRPARVTRAPAARAPATDRGLAGGDYGPLPPEVHEFSFDPGRTTYQHVYDGITLTVRFSSVRAPSGTPVDIDVQATSASWCCSTTMWYGDGQGADDSSSRECPSAPRTAGSLQRTKAWNQAGRWRLLISAGGGPDDCSGPGRYVGMLVTVEIAPGTSVSNGPFQPVVHVGDSIPHPSGRQHLTFYGEARDDDGYISRFELDPGDGSPVVHFPGDENGCRQGSGGQPVESRAWLPQQPPYEHRYPGPGTYTVTLRAFSQGCDGGAVQVGSDTMVWQVP